jgi:isopropylmalate/homocitrate/citramalate synthase
MSSRLPLAASALNGLDALVERRTPPASLRVTDVTLREAEQAGEGVVFTLEQKLELALALERAGVRQVQVGYPGRFARDFEMTRAVVQELQLARVEAVALCFLPEWQNEVDASIATGAGVVLVSMRASERHRRLLGMTEDEVVARATSAIGRACDTGVAVSFAVSDTTRVGIDLLRRLWAAAAGAGAKSIGIADSVGAATPELIAHLVRLARTESGLDVGVHCHNDFGLAVANTLAGIMAGATIADVAMNGLGDRAGNAALEEVVAALAFLYELDSGIALSQLTELSRTFAEASGLPVPAHKAITGDETFTHSLPTHVNAMQQDERALQPFEAALVGNTGRLVGRSE